MESILNSLDYNTREEDLFKFKSIGLLFLFVGNIFVWAGILEICVDNSFEYFIFFPPVQEYHQTQLCLSKKEKATHVWKNFCKWDVLLNVHRSKYKWTCHLPSGGYIFYHEVRRKSLLLLYPPPRLFTRWLIQR